MVKGITFQKSRETGGEKSIGPRRSFRDSWADPTDGRASLPARVGVVGHYWTATGPDLAPGAETLGLGLTLADSKGHGRHCPIEATPKQVAVEGTFTTPIGPIERPGTPGATDSWACRGDATGSLLTALDHE